MESIEKKSSNLLYSIKMIEDSLYDGSWVPFNKREKLSYFRMMGIASANAVPRIIVNLLFLFFVPACRNLEISTFSQSMLLLTGSIIEFILVPFLGSLSDGLMLKYGRRRIFIIIGSILALLSLLLLHHSDVLNNTPKDKLKGKKSIFIISLFLGFISVNIIQMPARVLCSDLTPPKQQNLMSNICQFFSGIGPLTSNLVFGLFSYKYSNVNLFLFIFNISIASVAVIVTCIAAREEPLRSKPESVNPFKQMYFAFKKMPLPFSRIILPFILLNIAVYQFQINFSNFVIIEVFQSKDVYEAIIKGFCFAMLCLAVNNICQIIYSLVNYFRINFFGMRWTMVAGSFILTLSLFLFLFISEKYLCMILSGLIGISQVIISTIPYAIVSLVIPTEELGINFGILNSFAILGQQISNWGVGALINSSSFQSKESKKIAISSIFSLLAVISSWFIVQPSIIESEEYNKISDDQESDDFKLSIDP